MEKEVIGVTDRVKMRGLQNKGLIEISLEKKTGDYIIVMSRGIQRKSLIFNLPEGMWKVRCSREEVPRVINDFMTEIV